MSTIDLIFMYYFLGLAVLWIILKIRERLQLTTLKTGDWQNQLADDVLLFCLSYYPSLRKKPIIRFVSDESNLAGQFCFTSNSIILYRKNSLNKTDLINTVIHEYFHYYIITSKTKYNLYQEQLDLFTYANHPQEVLCKVMGKTLASIYLSSKK